MEMKEKTEEQGRRYRKRPATAGLIGCWILLSLSGCTAQELEARDFVSVLTIPDGAPENFLAERQRKNVCTLDYSHTKAVILDKGLVQNPEGLDKVLKILLSNPEFAWNLLVFTGEEETLWKAEKENEKLGLELAAYYKNQEATSQGQGERAKLEPVTLLDLWNWRIGSGGEMGLPVLSWQEDNLMPEGVLNLT